MSHENSNKSDATEQRPVPLEWRSALCQVASAFAAGNYNLEPAVPHVQSVSASTALQIRDYIDGYGATLIPLPEEAWDSSVCICYGKHWDVLVDLWTKEEGRSDLVMHAQVVPSGSDFTVKVHAVYVP